MLLGETVKKGKTFKYIGSTMVDDGHLDTEVTRSKETVKDRKRLSEVICDRRMNIKVKINVPRTELRPTLLYVNARTDVRSESQTWQDQKEKN